MKKGIFALALSLFMLCSFAQTIPRLVWLDGEEIKNLSKRKLVLCTYTESDSEITRLEAKLGKAKDEKKKTFQDRIDYHKSLNKIFRDDMLNLVRENWTLGSTENIEVFSFTDLMAQSKKKKTDTAVLMLRYIGQSGSSYDPINTDVDFPAMTLQGIEHFGNNARSISFPLIASSEKLASRQDAVLTIKLLDALVTDNLKSAKRLDVNDFVKASVKKNCNKKKELATCVNKELLRKIEPGEVQIAYGHKVELMSNEDFISTYEGTDPVLAAVCIPVTIGQGRIGPISSSALIYGRMVINTKTGEIFGYSDLVSGELAGEVMFKKEHFENMGECK